MSAWVTSIREFIYSRSFTEAKKLLDTNKIKILFVSLIRIQPIVHQYLIKEGEQNTF